jgi:hypothetical protein
MGVPQSSASSETQSKSRRTFVALVAGHIRIAAQTLTYVASKGGDGVDTRVRELTLISLIACFCLGLAWAHEEDFFAITFAAAAAIAVPEAVRRSL